MIDKDTATSAGWSGYGDVVTLQGTRPLWQGCSPEGEPFLCPALDLGLDLAVLVGKAGCAHSGASAAPAPFRPQMFP